MKKKNNLPEKTRSSVESVWYTKRYLKTRPVCKVTFRLPAAVAGGAGRVALVGDFNDWSIEACLMKRLKNGDFTATIDLPAGVEYRYRFFIDGCRWENDWCPDRYAPNPYGSDDSVIAV